MPRGAITSDANLRARALLVRYRREHGLTQTDVAEMWGLNQSAIAALEGGEDGRGTQRQRFHA